MQEMQETRVWPLGGEQTATYWVHVASWPLCFSAVLTAAAQIVKVSIQKKKKKNQNINYTTQNGLLLHMNISNKRFDEKES